MSTERLIEVRGLRFGYPGSDYELLSDVTFDIEPGELIGLVGENGAGKSTLLDLIAGDLEPDGGNINISDDIDVGYLPQGQYPFGRFTCSETVRYLGALHSGSSTRYDHFLKRIPDEGLQGRLRKVASRFLWQISGGERQALYTAITLTRESQVYLLDEPFTAMDRTVRECFVRWIPRLRERGASVVMISHDDRDLDVLATRTVSLSDGRVQSS